MGNWWKRAAGLSLAGLAGATMCVSPGEAAADTIEPYRMATASYIDDQVVPASEAGTLRIYTTKGGGGTFIHVRINNKRVPDICSVSVVGMPPAGRPQNEPIGDGRGDVLLPDGSAQLVFGPFGNGRAHVSGACAGEWNGVTAVDASAPDSRTIATWLSEPRVVHMNLGGGAVEAPRSPGNVPNPHNQPTPAPPSSTRDNVLDYTDCAPLTADALTDGQAFSDPVTGSLAVAMKAICAQVAYFSGDEKLQLELICEAFIDASTALIPLPKVRGQNIDVSPDFARAAGWVSDQWPAFKKAVNDAKCKGRQDYPTYSGSGGGGW